MEGTLFLTNAGIVQWLCNLLDVCALKPLLVGFSDSLHVVRLPSSVHKTYLPGGPSS